MKNFVKKKVRHEALWQKKSTGSATLKKFSLFDFRLCDCCLFPILVFDVRLFNFKKNSELSSQFLISIIQFVTFYK
eukprot:UN27161